MENENERDDAADLLSQELFAGRHNRCWLGTVEHHDVADAHDEMAAGFFGEQRREFFFLILEIGELDLDQFMLRECLRHGADKAVAQAGLADFQHGFQQLRRRLEFAELGIGQWFEHRWRSLIPPGQNTSGKRGVKLTPAGSKLDTRRGGG